MAKKINSRNIIWWLRKRIGNRIFLFVTPMLFIFAGLRCGSENCPERDPVMNVYEACNTGLYLVFKDQSTQENLIEKGMLSADSIMVYGESGLQFGIREDTVLKGIKIDFLGSDLCNKAREVFYYQNKSESTMRYVLYISYDKYPIDTLRLEVTSTVAGICLEDGAIYIGISGVFRQRQGNWEKLPALYYPQSRERYFILTK